ncbi:60S ribosomal protein L30 [Trifolium repens]|nr:60S ribosomal protein L30 [Trifolium repens]
MISTRYKSKRGGSSIALTHYFDPFTLSVPPSLSLTISDSQSPISVHHSLGSYQSQSKVPINLNRKFLSESKTTQESINNNLALVMKSGKYTLGYKTVLKSLRSSKGIA